MVPWKSPEEDPSSTYNYTTHQWDPYHYTRNVSNELQSMSFKWASNFDNTGLAMVRRTREAPIEIINRQGKTVRILPKTIGSIFFESDGLTLFHAHSMSGANIPTGRFGFLDTEYKIAIPPQFRFTSKFHEGLCAVMIGNQWNYIDHTGRIVIALPENISGCGDFSDGVACVAVGGRGDDNISPKPGARWAFIDRSGRFALKQTFVIPASSDRPDFVSGLAPVCIEEKRIQKFGFINKSGKFVVPPLFNAARNFSEGLAAVSVGPQGFVPEVWKRNPRSRGDMMDKFFRSYEAFGMSVTKLHQLLGDPERSITGFCPVSDMGPSNFEALPPGHVCDAYLINAGRCSHSFVWVQFDHADGKICRYRSTRQGLLSKWYVDNNYPEFSQ